MKPGISIRLIAMGLVLSVLPMLSYSQKHINLSFDGIKTVYMIPLKGSCTIRRSADAHVKIELSTSYKDDNVPVYSLVQKGDSLKVGLKDHPGNVRGGMPAWTLWVPNETNVTFKTGNGGVEVMDLTANVNIETGKGDVTISQSGGVFKITTGQGNISVTGLFLRGASEFGAGKGNCEVAVQENPKSDLTMGSGEGNTILNMKGHEINAKLIFQLTKHSRAVTPFSLGEGKTFDEPGNHEKQIEKSITLGHATSQIILKSGNGIVKLIK